MNNNNIISRVGTRRPRVLVISPEYPGLVGSGGIGTFTHHLISIIKNSFDVTLIIPRQIKKSEVIKLGNLMSIQILTFPDLELEANFRIWQDITDLQLASLYISHFLMKHQFDEVIAPDWEAVLFYSIRDKKIRGLHKETRFTIVAHGSTYWVSEGMENLIEDMTPKRYARRVFMEKYCLNNVDSLVAPSHYMQDWIKKYGISRPVEFLLNPLVGHNKEYFIPVDMEARKHISIGFFGRLEKRKGIAEFIKIAKFIENKFDSIEVVLLGKNSSYHGRDSISEIRRELQGPRYTVVHYEDMLSIEALDFFDKNKTIVIFPSNHDNLPYTLIEASDFGLICLAKNSGGHPDILSPEFLFESPHEVPAMLENIIKKVSESKCSLYSYKSANSLWLSYLASSKVHSSTESVNTGQKVSILVTHYNLGPYLREALSSLRDQTYKNLEILVWDDGSTEIESKFEFRRMEDLYSEDARFKFFHGDNLYLGGARNRLSELATGEIYIFFDADNVALPEMTQTFVDALNVSGEGVLTCATIPFKDGQTLSSFPSYKINAWMPLGGPVLEGMRENVFGDANFAIRKEVFNSWGKFTIDRDTPNEDWAFLAKIACGQGLIEVVQVPLIHYRYRADSMLNTTSQTLGLWRVSKSFETLLPESFREEFRTLIIPELLGVGIASSFPVGRYNLYAKFEHIIWKHIPIGSIRRKLAQKIYRAIS